ncbi:poly(ADP-ribose) glycohydrolase isoform X2 [Tachysurus vachellii]|uniref:poly(ADP-ribose) glycohydrolase isoform X2 n=1 Tax=Tachysurus vachellii TaxID=175792 RepID=UPI00296AEF84|nr:poly(ADP-ribose) glycohydrolase isoform X2 [Tachysurus vachellii]
MKKFIIGYLALCTNHGQARCHSKMACKNDSSQMRECLSHQDTAKDSRAGLRQELIDISPTNQRHSEGECSGTEATDLSQKPDAEAQPGDICCGRKLKREPECHMQLDNLRADKNHTVLIDTKEFSHGKIVAYEGKHVWDANHVKLPQNYPVNSKESRWEATQRALQKLKPNKRVSVEDVEGAIKIYNQAHKHDWHFDALRMYAQENESGFSHVIPKMAKLALRLPELIQHPIPLLREKSNHKITLSQEQISCLLAHAFFCTFPHRNANCPGSEYINFPSINFSRLFAERSPRTFQKLRALFHYFSTVTGEGNKPTGLVTFERIYIPQSQCPEWEKRKEHLTNVCVYAKGFIEKEGSGMLQVDFAASMVGGGVLGRGLVQEEIRFLQCPELIVARLFTEKLSDNECLKITGVQTYSNTSGYSDSFVWERPYTDCTKRDEWKRRYCQIVAIDATNFEDPRQQYSEKSIKRELFKAFVGFRRDPNIPIDYTPAIATGNWGCGAFKGDPMLKALIQMMAAAVAQRDLAYFTFNNEKQAGELQRMFDFLKCHQVTVGNLYNLLHDYGKYHSLHQRGKNVFEYIREKIGHTSHL